MGSSSFIIFLFIFLGPTGKTLGQGDLKCDPWWGWSTYCFALVHDEISTEIENKYLEIFIAI